MNSNPADSAGMTQLVRYVLTRTESSVAAISAALGFDDASCFCRYFEKCTCQTPLAFRQAMASA